MVKHRSGTLSSENREVEWCCVRSVPCIRRRGARVSWLSLKTKVDGFPVWVSKPTAPLWWFKPQNHRIDFLICVSKSSRLRFVGCAIKPMGGWLGMGHASRSDGLFRLEASRSRISQSVLKTDRDAMTGVAYGIMTDVTSSESWRRMGRCDGLRQTLPSKITVFSVLHPRGNLIFYSFAWPYKKDLRGIEFVATSLILFYIF
jgi:hypothetical protein